MNPLELQRDHRSVAETRPAALALRCTADKWYGSRQVLTQATLAVAGGTVHALVGENGAGKSTFMGIIAGLVSADGGSLYIDPSPHSPPGSPDSPGRAGPIDPTAPSRSGSSTAIALSTWTTAKARAAGIAIVQQHGAFAGSLSLVENAVLGAEPVRRGILDLAATANALRALGDRIGLPVDPWARVDRLSPGVAQRAEIVAALHAGAKLVILDEPTAVLAPIEVSGLLATLRALAAHGTTVILVTHKLDEVRQVAHGITVLRAGATVATFEATAPTAQVARAMVGSAEPEKTCPEPAARFEGLRATALTLQRVSVSDAVRGVSLSVGAGEIVGLAGVDGNGQRELALAVAGLLPHAGKVLIGSRDVSTGSPAARLAAGLAHVPEDRHHGGLILDDSVAQNLALGRRDITGRFRICRAAVAAHADAQMTALDIRPADRDAIVRTLSGGNQQKIVVARELSRPSLVAVIACQPTRGLDFAAVARIRDRLRAAAAVGVGVLVISADLDELLTLCHRVIAMLRGAIVGERTGDSLRDGSARIALGELMTGAQAT